MSLALGSSAQSPLGRAHAEAEKAKQMRELRDRIASLRDAEEMPPVKRVRKSKAKNSPVSATEAKQIVPFPEVAEPGEDKLRVVDIRRAVEELFFIAKGDLTVKVRFRDIMVPRHIAMFLARKHTKLSWTQIAYKFGCDHTTTQSAVNKIVKTQHSYPLCLHLETLRKTLGIEEI